MHRSRNRIFFESRLGNPADWEPSSPSARYPHLVSDAAGRGLPTVLPWWVARPLALSIETKRDGSGLALVFRMKTQPSFGMMSRPSPASPADHLSHPSRGSPVDHGPDAQDLQRRGSWPAPLKKQHTRATERSVMHLKHWTITYANRYSYPKPNSPMLTSYQVSPPADGLGGVTLFGHATQRRPLPESCAAQTSDWLAIRLRCTVPAFVPLDRVWFPPVCVNPRLLNSLHSS